MGSAGAGFTLHLLRNHYKHSFLPGIDPGTNNATEGGIKWMEELADGDHLVGSDQTSETASFKEKVIKSIKIALPHVGLTTLLLSYIAGGAAIFQWLETQTEIERKKDKAEEISRMYQKIVNTSYRLCTMDGGTTYAELRSELLGQLKNLSLTHEYDTSGEIWESDPDLIVTRWTFPSAVLYALTVITTTGYDYISPLTDFGRLFTVFFGLFGIPLMFITAADIGKFLSECVTALYGKYLDCVGYVYRRICRPLRNCCCSCRRRRGRVKTTSNCGGTLTPNGDVLKGEGVAEGGKEGDDTLTSTTTAAPPLNPFDELEQSQRVQLPIFSYFFLILGYCAVGALMFTQYESGLLWTFIHGFFFSFNTITTIGLGNIRVFNVIYLCLIVAYVIVGLAVITMCVDLASSQLKVFFTNLHYFGRKFRGAHGAFMNMSDDIKEAMKIINALKRTRAAGDGGDGTGGITLEDIKQFLEIEREFDAGPYVPRNINFLRWVDDEEATTTSSSARSVSISGGGLKTVSSDPALHM